jgi:hypothetical protein
MTDEREPTSGFNCRPYDPEKDREAARRIWREVGWLEKGHEEELDAFVRCGRALVSEIDGEAECLVTSAPGTIRYLREDLPFAAVTCVTTSRIARKQGIARRLAARLLAADARDGALVSGLGMFEQGFYNRLGFGTGAYEHWVSFDPARLKVSRRHRVPKRFSGADWERAHRARLRRTLRHGSCCLTPPEITRLDVTGENAFGLGYADAEGELTHGIWCDVKDRENGPYTINWWFHQTPEQFLELLALIKSLGDQVRSVGTNEPTGVMLQDFLLQPFKERQVTKRSPYESRMTAQAYTQYRVLDVPGCLARTLLPGADLRFNLRLSDPVEASLPEAMEWRGVAGEYVVSLGPCSGAERGWDDALPPLEASVGAFTRLWLGSLPATGLRLSDDLSGPPGLLEALDDALRLPTPHPDWDF